MNKEMNKADGKIPAVIMVPEPKLKQIVFGMTRLAEMHLGLIGLYEEESRLKKQHKPYLFLREHADQVCEKDKKAVKAIMNAVLDFEDTEEKKDKEPDDFDPEKCRGCIRYDDCEEYFMQIRAEEKNRKAQENADTDEASDQEAGGNFNLPEGLVMMSTDTLGTMQDDMLQLTEALDHMVGLLRNGVTGIPIKKAAAEEAVKRGAALSEEIFKRWDDADIIALG